MYKNTLNSSMYAYGNVYKKPTTPAVPAKIFNMVDYSNVGILFWNESTLKSIAQLSGPLAKSNEFQIHYWALNVRLTFGDGSIVDLSIPTVIYNYAQTVSTAHIDFELKDVSAMSDMLKPLHTVEVNKLIGVLKTYFENNCKDLDIELSFQDVPQNTMHRHPTGVSSFSSTDLNKSHTYNTGIVFPLERAKNTPSFSSIIYNNPVRMIHTEYRIADGDVTSANGITYREGKCFTYVAGSIHSPTGAAALFGAKDVDSTYSLNPNNISMPSFINTLLSSLKYEQNTQFVKAENVSEKVYAPKTVATTTTQPGKALPSNQGTSLFDVPVTTYPHDVKKEFKEKFKLTIHDLKDTEKLKLKTLKKHILKLEHHYYEDDSIVIESYAEMSHKELIELSMTLQDDIIDAVRGEEPAVWQDDTEDTAIGWGNVDDLLDVDDKREMLQMMGLYPDNQLENASDQDIHMMFEQSGF